MTELVDQSRIEEIVGHKRHARAHFARAVSEEQTVYILHSQLCLEDYPDLRDCPYSLALDNGIDIDRWPLDSAQPVGIYDQRLEPIRIA